MKVELKIIIETEESINGPVLDQVLSEFNEICVNLENEGVVKEILTRATWRREINGKL